MVIGVKTARTTAHDSRAQPMSPSDALPAIRSRTAITTRVTGLTLTMAWSQPGIVLSDTQMFVVNTKGNKIMMLACITDSGVRIVNPKIVQIVVRLNANTSMSAKASTTPTTPPSGRNPSATPSTKTTIAANV